MPRIVVVIETDQELLDKLLETKRSKECDVPPESFAALVFQFLSGITQWPRIPAPPQPTVAPDIEP